MKKLAVLFVALACAVSVFAIEGIGDFTAGLEMGVYNVTGSSAGGGGGADRASATDPAFGIEPFISYERDFSDALTGLKLKATVGTVLRIASGDTADMYDALGGGAFYDEFYIEVVPSYALSAGPGLLTFALAIKPVFYPSVFGLDTKHIQDPKFIFNPLANYTMEMSFGTLGFEMGTDDMFTAYGLSDKGKGYGLAIADLYLKALYSMGMPMGRLSFWAAPRIAFKCSKNQSDTRLTELRLDGTYAMNDIINFGLEIRAPVGSKDAGDNFDAKGMFLRPHVDSDLSSIVGLPINAWGALELSQIGAKSPRDELVLSVIVGGSYKF
jgi:hypothetical protein